MSRLQFLLPAMMMGMLVMPLSAENKPDFTGTWKMDEKASPASGPTNIVFKIAHKEPAFKYSASGRTADGEAFTEDLEFKIDGKEYPGPGSLMVTAHWEDQALVLLFGGEITVVFKQISGGKQMVREIMGSREVYNKQ